MPSVIAVDPAHYVAASSWFGHDLVTGLNRIHLHLAHDLHDTAAMAGHDSSGRAWGQGYDAAAVATTNAVATLQQACLKLATMLQRTGFNHGLAESMSDAGHPIDVPDTADYTAAAPILSTCGDAPSAAGGSGDYPDGWSLVRSTVGFEWPDGRSGALRSAAVAWATAGRAIADLTGFVDDAIASIRLQQSPEVADAVVVCRGVSGHLSTVATACTSLSRACAELASAIDKAHHSAITTLKILVASSVATQVLGAIGAVFSFGAAEAPAQAAEAGEIAVVASEVSGYLGEFAAEAGTAFLLMSELDGEVAAVSRLLEPVLSAELVTADTTLAPAVAGSVAQSAEIAAESRLGAAAGTARVDLAAAERAGGHTLARHVGRTDEQLIARNIDLSATFPDAETATKWTTANLARHSALIDQWLSGKAGKLVLKMPADSSTGRIYVRETGRYVEPSAVRTVLVRNDTGYIVKTSFPDI